MFRDECEFEAIAGKGGDGLVSFRREKYVPRGGPDGGDGGHGGSVILRADPSLNSLVAVGRAPKYAAQNGTPGGPRNRTGATGEDEVVLVPVGTQVLDAERGHLLKDLAEAGQELVVAEGGRGGKGNTSFATAVVQAPRKATSGKPGERRKVRLELKLFAELGLVGLPNAGKSTFLSAVSRATPKIADYPFTTLDPQVGIASVGDYDTLVVADLPGLIEGAADGQGLGHRFLRHVERCRVLAHLVDVSQVEVDEAVANYETIERELQAYSQELFERPRIVVASKVEDDASRDRALAFASRIERPVHLMSSHTGEGVAELLAEARRLVRPSEE
ncbi:MAG: GTPase ObgE [Planctomycetota bacterium]|jgi:GTP-binding protein